MTRATLTFSLPADQAEFDLALKGGDYKMALEDLREAFRKKAKYSEEETTTWQAAYELFWETLKEAGVELN